MARKREVLPPTAPLLQNKQNKHCQSYSGLGEQATHKDINFVAKKLLSLLTYSQ